jgi:PKD repeat protein
LTVDISGNLPSNLTWGVALDPKVPVRVLVGGREFPFGQKVGNVTILSDHEIAYSTTASSGSLSSLDLNFLDNTWEFSAGDVDRPTGTILAGHTVKTGISAKTVSAIENLPYAGSQSFVWTTEGGSYENPVFSFDGDTRIVGSFVYPCTDKERDSFIIGGARFNKSAFNPNSTLSFTVNKLKFEFANATARKGDQYQYEMISKDCNVSLEFDTVSGIWTATITGPRLSTAYWGGKQGVNLQIGTVAGRETFTTPGAGTFSWPGRENPLVAAFTGTPREGYQPLTVAFTDQSAGNPTSWSWAFGDGTTSEEKNPVHTYTSEGNYPVFLLVRNGENSDSLQVPDYITVGEKQSFQADFAVMPVTGTAPLTVKCTDKSIGNPSMRVYNFGDGTNVTGPNPAHTYKFPGNYTITLTITKYNAATGSVMSSTATKVNLITVNRVPSTPLVASFTASPVAGTAPLKVTFTDHSTGSPSYLNFDFGDGFNATGKNPVHLYQYPGVYNVTLTVLKNDGINGSVISNASVQNGMIIVN